MLLFLQGDAAGWLRTSWRKVSGVKRWRESSPSSSSSPSGPRRISAHATCETPFLLIPVDGGNASATQCETGAQIQWTDRDWGASPLHAFLVAAAKTPRNRVHLRSHTAVMNSSIAIVPAPSAAMLATAAVSRDKLRLRPNCSIAWVNSGAVTRQCTGQQLALPLPAQLSNASSVST